MTTSDNPFEGCRMFITTEDSKEYEISMTNGFDTPINPIKEIKEKKIFPEWWKGRQSWRKKKKKWRKKLKKVEILC